ncbi:signal peptidase I [Duganella sp. 1224]|uniref:signal peptidase I n=1 Tax=Duganella sp. 1224 TaxID=2587052 RepID=UPI0015CBAD3C|nr:signal peptidase I [Duganella sp. 1224]NYE62649.1 signal peptidase I [Duganella sp. 1224]
MKPKKWIAVVLGILASPLAFLYVGAPRWALLAFALSLVVGIASFLVPGQQALFGVLSLALMVLWIWRAYRFAGQRRFDEPRPWYSRWHGIVGVVVVASLVAMSLRVFVYEPFRIPSSAMLPTLPVGANVLVQKWGYGYYGTMGYRLGHGAMTAPLSRGDILVFDYPVDPRQTYIKRVVGLPGDKIVYRDKHVLVNGVDVRGQQLADYLDPERLAYRQRYREKLDQTVHDILLNDGVPSRQPGAGRDLSKDCTDDGETLSCTVPPASYFVMGDNRDNSLDSRYWGFVPASAVLGKVVYTALPRQ